MQTLDTIPDPAATAAMHARRERTQMVLAAAAARGWEDEHNPAKPGRWWLPGTTWHLRCVHDKCTIYRITHGRGTVETKPYWLTQASLIIERLEAIATRTREAV